MLKKLLVVFVLAVLTSVVGAQPVEVPFFLTFVPNIQFAPLYVAIENGYFLEEGLDVRIQHGDEPDGVDLIAAGSIDFGVIGGEQVIQARANDRDVVFVYEWFQRYPIGVVVDAASEIETVNDLAGQRVGIPGRFGASYSGLVALLAANGMTESDIQLEAIGFNAPEVFCIGAIGASVIYINNEPLQIQQRADAGDCGAVEGVRVLPISDYVDLVSNGLTTSGQLIRENPERVQAMVRAFERGLQDVIANPAQAYLISTTYVENLPLDEAFRAALEAEAAEPNPDGLIERLSEQFDGPTLLQLAVLVNSIDLWSAEELGYTEPESWVVTQDTLLTMGFLEQPIELEAAYSNDFLP